MAQNAPDEMNPHCINLRRAIFVWDWGTVALTAAILLVGFVLYRTAMPGDPPLYNERGAAKGWRAGQTTVVQYDRSFTIRYPFDGTVYRTVECEGQRTFDVPAITRQFTAGNHLTQRTFSMEYPFQVGKGCILRTWVEHRPFGSLRAHTYELQKTPFFVYGEKAEGAQ